MTLDKCTPPYSTLPQPYSNFTLLQPASISLPLYPTLPLLPPILLHSTLLQLYPIVSQTYSTLIHLDLDLPQVTIGQREMLMITSDSWEVVRNK